MFVGSFSESIVSNMRAVFSSLLAVLLILHSAFGCCRLHAQNEVRGNMPAVAHCCHECGHCHDGREQDDKSDDDSSKGHECYGLCNYLLLEKSPLVDVKQYISFDFAIIAPVACNLQVVVVNNFTAHGESAPELPMRLHLFNQILLI